VKHTTQTTDTQEFKTALYELPNCITGYDALTHLTPDDLAWLVLLQIDLREEGEESDIKTNRQLVQCRRYVARYLKAETLSQSPWFASYRNGGAK
jgi:hypothetical protein